MEISDKCKILILLVIVVAAIYFLNSKKTKEPIHNEGSLSYDPDRVVTYNEIVDDESQNSQVLNTKARKSRRSKQAAEEESRMSSNSSLSSLLRSELTEGESVDRSFKQKMTTRDSAKPGEYKHSSYKQGMRGGRATNLDNYFEKSNPFSEKTYKGFGPNDESGDLANYVPGRKRKLSEEDKFNAADLLPDESNKKWFEDVQTTSIKNSHMINIYRPVGVNTIMTTLKNPSHDIRGTPPNPRNFVSPWNMSSIEPDMNIRNQALCY